MIQRVSVHTPRRSEGPAPSILIALSAVIISVIASLCSGQNVWDSDRWCPTAADQRHSFSSKTRWMLENELKTTNNDAKTDAHSPNLQQWPTFQCTFLRMSPAAGLRPSSAFRYRDAKTPQTIQRYNNGTKRLTESKAAGCRASSPLSGRLTPRWLRHIAERPSAAKRRAITQSDQGWTSQLWRLSILKDSPWWTSTQKHSKLPKLRTEYKFGITRFLAEKQTRGEKTANCSFTNEPTAVFSHRDPNNPLHEAVQSSADWLRLTKRLSRWSSDSPAYSSPRSAQITLSGTLEVAYLLSSQRLHTWKEARGGAAGLTGAHWDLTYRLQIRQLLLHHATFPVPRSCRFIQNKIK